jgi:hypothetical protein
MKKSYGSRRITALLLALLFILPYPAHAKVTKAYVAALYLPEGVKAEDVLSDALKRLEISYLVSIRGPLDEKPKRDLLNGKEVSP